jgi:hypothetical protein
VAFIARGRGGGRPECDSVIARAARRGNPDSFDAAAEPPEISFGLSRPQKSKSNEAGETPALPGVSRSHWSAGVPPAMRAAGSRMVIPLQINTN